MVCAKKNLVRLSLLLVARKERRQEQFVHNHRLWIFGFHAHVVRAFLDEMRKTEAKKLEALRG